MKELENEEKFKLSSFRKKIKQFINRTFKKLSKMEVDVRVLSSTKEHTENYLRKDLYGNTKLKYTLFASNSHTTYHM